MERCLEAGLSRPFELESNEIQRVPELSPRRFRVLVLGWYCPRISRRGGRGAFCEGVKGDSVRPSTGHSRRVFSATSTGRNGIPSGEKVWREDTSLAFAWALGG